MSRKTAREVSSISTCLRYLVIIVEREENVVVRCGLALFCAVVAVGGGKSVGTERGRSVTCLKWEE